MHHRERLSRSARCGYIHACYLADALRCFGYKTDCAVYLKSNGRLCSEDRFHEAMDRLIDRTRMKYMKVV